VLVIVYHLLSDPTARFHDLGAEHYESRINKERRARKPSHPTPGRHRTKIVIRNGMAAIIEPEAA